MIRYIASCLALILAVGCGRFKDKDNDDDQPSADAIAEGSDIKWDEPVNLNGALAQDGSRNVRYKFVYEKNLKLILNQDANMKIKIGESTSNCPAGNEFAGFAFTITSSDGLFVRSTDSIDKYVQPTALEIFPGKIPPGAHSLTIRAYGSGPCRFNLSFSFPNPDGDSGFPVSEENTTVDSDLTGTWLMSGNESGIMVKSTWSFANDRTMSFTMTRGDITRIQYTGKYQLDSATIPNRIRIVITNASVSQFAGAPTTGDILRCIYLPTPSGRATILYWQCMPVHDVGFPSDFTPEAEEYTRTGTIPGTLPDFDLTKGGDVTLAIPDNDLNGLIYQFEFATEGSSVVDLGIQFRVQHTQTSDLRLRLVHPDGTSALLFDRESSTSTTVSKSFGFGGSRLAGLDAFKGKPLNGKWKLIVTDEVAEDTGELYFAKLILRGKY